MNFGNKSSNTNSSMNENQYKFPMKSMDNMENIIKMNNSINANNIRKRSSFMMTNSNNDEMNKENIPPPRKMSFNPHQTLARSQSLLQANNSQMNINNILSDNFCFPDLTRENGTSSIVVMNNINVKKGFLPSQPEALDLRTGTSRSDSTEARKRIFRCFQCNCSSENPEDINSHFVLTHFMMLTNFKAFRISVSMYHRLLFNQFSTVLQLHKGANNPFQNEKMICSLCNYEVISNRLEFLQHFVMSHFQQAIWVCVICGTNHQHESYLANHIKQHHWSVVNAIQQKHNQMQNGPAQLLPVVLPPRPIENSAYAPAVIPNQIRRHRTTLGPHLASSTPKGNKMVQNSASQLREASPTPSSSQDTQQNASQSSQRTLKCLVCDATARWRSELFTHMITHSKHRSFGCKFCNYRSKWKWDVPKHLKRCRMAPPAIRHPDVQNSYLITLLQHYAPPPGDILYEFMRQYNIKDIGVLNRSSNANSNSLPNTSPDILIPSTSHHQSHVQTVENTNKSECTQQHPIETAYSDISEDYIEDEQQKIDELRDHDEEEEEVDIEGDDSSPKLLDTSIREGSLKIDENSNYNPELSHNNEEVELSVSPIPSSTHTKAVKKACPWCTLFETNDAQEMIEHIQNKHGLSHQ